MRQALRYLLFFVLAPINGIAAAAGFVCGGAAGYFRAGFKAAEDMYEELFESEK